MNIRVGIVEDHGPLRASLADGFNAEPGFCCVAACGDAEEALKRLPDARPDVVIMDIRLPGLSGIECVRLLRERLPELQCLMLTVEDDAESLFQAILAGATGYLLKGSSMAQLVAAVRELLEGGSPMSGSIARKTIAVMAAFARERERRRERERERGRGRDPAADADELLEALSAREVEVLQALARGRLYKEIADEQGVSYHTIRAHVRSIYRKLQVTSRREAIQLARRLTESDGLPPPNSVR